MPLEISDPARCKVQPSSHTSLTEVHMFMRRLTVFIACVLTAASAAAQIPETIFEGIARREVGPAIMSGRVTDFAVFEEDPDIFYVGSASGGLLKTVNGGSSWENVFDSQTT